MPIKLAPVNPEPVDLNEEQTALVEVGGLKWQQLRQIGMTLYPSTSQFGKPTAFLCTSRFLAIGTYSAEILLFNYSQQLIAHLSASEVALKSDLGQMLGPITALNVDADEGYLIAGSALGYVLVWDLEAPPHNKPKLVASVAPLDPENVPFGESIIQRRETHVHGTPVLHCCFTSRPLKGKLSFWSIDARGLLIEHRNRRVILEKVTLSKRLLGSYTQPVAVLGADSTQEHSMLALITDDTLLGLNFQAKTVLSVPRNKDTAVESEGVGCVKFHNKNLVYSWYTELKSMAFDEEQVFSASSAYSHPVPITKLDYIGQKLVVVASKTDFSLVDLGNQLVIDSDTSNLSPASTCLQMAVLDTSIFIMGKYEFSVGKFTNWADRLLSLLDVEHPVEAVKLAVHYLKDDGGLEVLGLPSNKAQKDKAIIAALPELLMLALQFGLDFDESVLKDLIPETVTAVVIANLPLLESIMETIETNPLALENFFQALLHLVQQRTVRELPPAVFRALVAKHPEPKLFYNLSLATLDLDLAFKMCKQYPSALNSVKIYLENQALNDFISPITDSKSSQRYDYLSMVLTSRVYPTGEDMEASQALESKKQIYSALFMGEWQLLVQLLNDDEKAMLDALNLGLQDPWFNEENVEINRQIVVNVLLKCRAISINLAIFLARNYPKYKQFIVLKGSVLDEIVNTLCQPVQEVSGNKINENTEEQLALLSLLSVYKIVGNTEFIQKLKNSKYLLVLEHVFRKQGRLLDLAEAQLSLTPDEVDVFSTLSESLVKNRKEGEVFVDMHFEQLLNSNAATLGKLVARYNLLNAWDRKVPLEFYDAAFEEIHKRGGQLPSSQICTTYVSLLVQSKQKSRLMWVLRNVLTRENDIILPIIVDSLIEEGEIDVLAMLLERKERYTEALIYLVNYFNEAVDLEKYVLLACNLCQKLSRENRQEGIKAYQRLIEALVEINNSGAALQKVVEVIAESDVSDVIQLVKHLLEFGTTPPKASIVADLHTSILQRERALKCFLQIVQVDGYQDLLKVLQIRAQGWIVPVDGECEVCGGKIVGLGINAIRLYAAWEDKQRGKPSPGGDAEDDTLVLFQCNHSYHYRCLQRMTSQRQCIICS